MRSARILLGFLLVATVSACVSPSGGRRPTGQRPTQPPMIPPTEELRQCLADLQRVNARYSLVANPSSGSGCSTLSTIQLTGVGIPVTNITAIQCPLARTLTLWTRDAVQPAARSILGSPVVKLESMGSYSCRNVIGRAQAAGTRSEHATGNAVDVSGFVLADGRRITVEAGWNGSDDERKFLRQVRQAACQRFQTVLSPDFNAAHYNHLHFDLGRGPYCR